MQASPQPTRFNHDESKRPSADRTCSIVTFYEDFPAAIRAHRSFDRVAQNFSGNLPVRATSWSFAMLGRSQLKATVVRDSASADVIVIAANGRRELPEHIAEWVENCITHDPGNGTVLVALHEDADELQADGKTFPLCASLERIAHRQGATFMCAKDLGGQADPDRPMEPAFETCRDSTLIALGAPDPKPIANRWWGIND